MQVDLRLGDCLDVIKEISSASIDAIITDPPYPCIKREYGTWTEAEWHAMMRRLIPQCRRVLKPSGSAVFILQPNSERVGRMRPWLWDFMAWTAREWNQVQDVWWWNTTALPKCGQVRSRALPRPSAKACVWLGEPDCYRAIDEVLIPVSESTRRRIDSIKVTASPSGWRGDVKPKFKNGPRMCRVAVERGGSTPFNVLPIANANSTSSAGSYGHPAGTPGPLADWWTRYISPEGGTILDPFCGSGTMGLAALKRNRSFIGIERFPKYFAIAQRRLAEAQAATPLFA